MCEVLLALICHLNGPVAVIALLSIRHEILNLRIVQVNILAAIYTHIGCNSLVREVNLTLILLLLHALLILYLLEVALKVFEVEVSELL